MSGLPLDVHRLDRDGAIGETLTRAGFLAAAGGLVLAADARAIGASDKDILNYALTLEYLQAAFYTEAERLGALRGTARQAVEVVGAVERAHVRSFRELLGRDAVARPSFDFQGVTEKQDAFLKTAVAFEDLAVEAYKGAATAIRSDAVLVSALGIHTVEARHAAWMRHLNGVLPAAAAFDEGRGRKAVGAIVEETGFITGRPRMKSSTRPDYTG